jgi:predicted PurR-regulated permease PerM
MAQSAGKRSRIGGWPLAAGVTAVLVFLFFVRNILLPFVLAAALAFVLTPAIDWAQRRFRAPRWIFATLAYVLILAIVGLMLFLFGGAIAQDVSDSAAQFPRMLHRYVAELARLAGPSLAGSIDSDAIANDILARLRSFAKSDQALSFAGYGVGAVFGLILSIVVLAYFLVSGKKIAAGVLWLVPPEYRDDVDDVLAKIMPLLWRYFFGLMVVVSYTSLLAWIAFGPVFRLPHAPLLAIVVGILELIPIIGPAATLGIVGVTASQQADLTTMVSLFGFAIALRISIDELVGPLVLGRAARLHPAVIIFAFLSGGALFGIIGLLLAVPFAASIKIVLGTYYAEPIRSAHRPD